MDRENTYKNRLIRKIESYGARYDPDCGLSIEDQLLACEAIAESHPVKSKPYETINTAIESENGSVSGLVSGTCKQEGNFEFTEPKLSLISKLKNSNYLTPPMEVAALLGELFKEWPWPEKPNHWLYIAQRHNPRAINRTLNEMLKSSTGGWKTFENPAKYFTSAIGHRKPRRRKNRSKSTDKA